MDEKWRRMSSQNVQNKERMEKEWNWYESDQKANQDEWWCGRSNECTEDDDRGDGLNQSSGRVIRTIESDLLATGERDVFKYPFEIDREMKATRKPNMIRSKIKSEDWVRNRMKESMRKRMSQCHNSNKLAKKKAKRKE